MNQSTIPVGPASYPRRVLLAVCGLSPQIVTETLYALATNPISPFVPTEVHLITTLEGARRAELSLLSEDLGWFKRLLKDYKLPSIQFDINHVHVITDSTGRPMDDIRSPEDNLAAADFITNHVSRISADPECALHVSIAGGRKTMGYYLGYALSLYGRAQDRMSHVLVSEPFESSWDFFYPTPYNRVLQTRDDKLADTATAQVTLAEIPFVSLRHGLPDALLAGKASFNDAVVAAQAGFAPPQQPELVLNLQRKWIRAGGVEVKLRPKNLAFLAMFARLAQQGGEALSAPTKDVPDLVWSERFLREYRSIKGLLGSTETTEDALKQGMDGDYFSVAKSQLNADLAKKLGSGVRPYLVDEGEYRQFKFSLKLRPDEVKFEI